MPEKSTEKEPFVRSAHNIMFAGICGALGERKHISPWIFRLLFFAGTVITGFVPGVVIYTIIWYKTPLEGKGRVP